MRDHKRIAQIMSRIEIIWMNHSDMRFGQLVDNLYKFYILSIGEDLPRNYFYIEDDGFLEYLENFKGF